MTAILTTYLAGGCFWGMEELFRQQPGVTDTEAGYTGGTGDNPTWYSHRGHAEALAISYDPSQTTYARLLDYFFRIHNPTTLNRQGNDVGSSYRSAIFYQNDTELQTAREVIKIVDDSGLYNQPVITTLEPFTVFHTAEAEHQDFLQHNPGVYTCHYARTDTSLLA